MALSKYHRDRPFLIITRHASPSDGEKTESKDWLKESRWKVEEMVSIVDRVTNKHLSEATIIVDILKRSLVKNRFTEEEPSEVLSHYLKTYKNHISEGISIWMRNKTTNLGDAEIFIHDLEDEIGEMERLHQIPVSIKNEDEKENNSD